MKILQSCGSASWGGLEIEVLKLSERLAAAGHSVTLLCRDNSTLQRKSIEKGLDTLAVPRVKASSPGAIFQIAKLLRRGQFEVVHTHLSADLGALVPAIDIAGWPGRLLLSKHVASNIRKKDIWHRYVYRRVSAVLAVSNYIRENVIHTCPINPAKVHRLPNGVDLKEFKALDYDRQAIRQLLNIPLAATCIALIGRITPLKGHREFLQAAKIVLDKTSQPVQFQIVGGASYGEEAYAEEIRNLCDNIPGLSGAVNFSPFCEDIRPLMAAVDILAVPSHMESFGNVIVEGLAMRLPVIACNSGGVPDIIEHGRNGLLVPPIDAVALAGAMLRLIEDPFLANNLALQGCITVKTQFQFQDYLEKTLEHYRGQPNPVITTPNLSSYGLRGHAASGGRGNFKTNCRGKSID